MFHVKFSVRKQAPIRALECFKKGLNVPWIIIYCFNVYFLELTIRIQVSAILPYLIYGSIKAFKVYF